MADKIYAKGIYFNEKNEKAPDFVLGSISIDLDIFDIDTLREYANGKYVRLQVLMGKEKPYVVVDTYKKEPKKELSLDDVPF